MRCLTIGRVPTAREPLRFTAAAAVFDVDDLSDMSEVEFEAAGCRMEVRRFVVAIEGGIIIMNLVEPAVFLFLVERGRP